MPLSILLLLVACGGEPAVTPAEAPTAVQEAPAAVPPLDLAAQQAAATQALAPSPAETRTVVERAGIGIDIATLVPTRDLVVEGASPDLLAVRTGVYLADTVLTLKEAPKDALVLRLERIHAGLSGMGAGAALLSTVASLTDKVRNDAISRDVLLDEVDAIVGMSVPGAGVGPTDRTGPLLQAGAWAATTNLVAGALLQSGKLDAADQLLRQKDVVAYFRRYVQAEGTVKADPALLTRLDAALGALAELAGRPHLGEPEVKAIQAHTAEILALL